MEERPSLTSPARIVRFRDGARSESADELATEEPLEIRLLAGANMLRAGVTMRTPGADFELAAGFLYGEGIIADASEIAGMSYCTDPQIDAAQQYNIVNVALQRAQLGETARLERHFSSGSACGVCGKAAIEDLQVRAAPLDDTLRVSARVLTHLPEGMRASQRVFSATGGLHAAALFDAVGTLELLREDVGRHNALDKLVGSALLDGRIPLRGRIALVSGRASYELVQKCIVAGISVLCAVSAPSSLAVSLAQAFNLTLLGFVREGRANVYAGLERVTD